MPFLFYIPADKQSREASGVDKEVSKDEFHVYICSFGYSPENVAWMDCPKLGKTVLVPSNDLTKEEYQFDTEEEALKFIAEWWRKQIA